MGKVPHLTSNWKSGASLIRVGNIVLVFTQAAQPGLCTGTRSHSPPPGSGWRHCDAPNAEKGTARLPCYQNNTLADNYWIAFKQCCLHTSKNTWAAAFIVLWKLHLPSPARQRRKTESRGLSADLTSRMAFGPRGMGSPETDSPWWRLQGGEGALAIP